MLDRGPQDAAVMKSGVNTTITAAVLGFWIPTFRRDIASLVALCSRQRCKHLESRFAAGASLAGMLPDCSSISGRLIAPFVKDRRISQITFLGFRQPTISRQPTKA